MTDAKTPSRRGTFLAEVLANERICDEHYRLILDVQGFPPTRPGQFVQLLCRPPRAVEGPLPIDWPEGTWPELRGPELADRETMLRRPFSIAARREHGLRVELDIIYRRVGTGTRWLAEQARPGDRLSLLGPLGNTFAIRPDVPSAALVGGGVGIPPMLYLAESLASAGKRTAAFNGARSASLLPLRLLPTGQVRPDGLPSRCVAEFAAFDVEAGIATDDGSLGYGGFVSEPLTGWLDESAAGAGDVVVYACGPEAMMRAVAELCLPRGIECQLSLERHMACGMGTCQSCVCKVRDERPEGWRFALCCTDGPVFDARDVFIDQ
jgi:dihydroorotate dehydrogenase electron transfer subunit